MATIDILSRLDDFRMIDAIRQVDSDSIDGAACFDQAPPFAGLEAMAQLAALHVRYRIDFTRHAFLLKVIQCQGPPGEVLIGKFMFKARRKSHSRNAFRYAVAIEGAVDDVLCSELLIGVCEYNKQFQAHYLQGYYQKMFTALCNRTSS